MKAQAWTRNPTRAFRHSYCNMAMILISSYGVDIRGVLL